MFSGIYFDLAHFYFMETWKDVLDYEGFYQVSDLGNVKSLERKRIQPHGGIRIYPEKLIATSFRGDYLKVELCKDGVRKTISVHRLVYEAFNGKTNLQIDHIIEGNKTDNRLCNLQSVTPRQNTAKHKTTLKKTSKYVGVMWYKKNNNWMAQISINGVNKYLGTFKNEIDAYLVYQNALKQTL